MRFEIVLAALLASTWVLPASAADKELNTGTGTGINTTTIAASAPLSPGRYVLTVVPNFNSDMAGRLQKAFKNTPGVTAVKANSDDSTVHLTIKDGAQIRAVDIQQTLAKTFPGAVAPAPVLEQSTTPHPGL